MDPRMIGGIFGAFLATGVLSQLSMWIIGKFMPDSLTRIGAAYAVAVVVGVILAGLGRADGGSPQFAEAAMAYLPGFAVWLVIDLLRWRGRQAKRG